MRLSLLFALFLVACASAQKAPEPMPVAPAAKSEPELPANPAPARVAEPMEESSRFHKDSDLRESISRWIADNPQADFEETARTANRLLRRFGYPMVLDASKLLKKNKNLLRLRAGKKIFLFESGKELSRSKDICGERFLRIPARIRGKNQAALISEGKEYPFSLQGFRRDRFRIFRDKKLLSVIYAPEPTEPVGLANNGKAIFIKFPLNEEAASEWWQRIAEFQPSIVDEDPYLILRVEASRLYFDENIEHLPAQEFEVDEGDNSSFRWRFQPSDLVLELSSRCN
jgi:hypothetical protein